MMKNCATWSESHDTKLKVFGVCNVLMSVLFHLNRCFTRFLKDCFLSTFILGYKSKMESSVWLYIGTSKNDYLQYNNTIKNYVDFGAENSQTKSLLKLLQFD